MKFKFLAILILMFSFNATADNLIHVNSEKEAKKEIPKFNSLKNLDELTVDRNTNTFYLHEITLAGFSAFEAESNFMALKGIKEITIVLHSPGGDVDVAMFIREQIRVLKENGVTVNTLVKSHDICASACPLVFLAGETHIASSDSVFMFHSPYYESESSNSIIISTVLERQLRRSRETYINLVVKPNCPKDPNFALDILDHEEHFYTADELVKKCGNNFFTSVTPIEFTELPDLLHWVLH